MCIDGDNCSGCIATKSFCPLEDVDYMGDCLEDCDTCLIEGVHTYPHNIGGSNYQCQGKCSMPIYIYIYKYIYIYILIFCLQFPNSL